MQGVGGLLLVISAVSIGFFAQGLCSSLNMKRVSCGASAMKASDFLSVITIGF